MNEAPISSRFLELFVDELHRLSRDLDRLQHIIADVNAAGTRPPRQLQHLDEITQRADALAKLATGVFVTGAASFDERARLISEISLSDLARRLSGQACDAVSPRGELELF
jgi:hypothetical protein